MSRYVTVRTQLRDMELLRQTLKCMGCATQDQGRLLAGRKADLVVQTPAGPLGFAQGDAEEIGLIGMEELVRSAPATQFLNQVTQQYARRKVIADAERAGYRLVEETVDADNSIRLVVRKW